MEFVHRVSIGTWLFLNVYCVLSDLFYCRFFFFSLKSRNINNFLLRLFFVK